MDCCGNTETKNRSKEESMKGGKSMTEKKSKMLWIVIGILVLATIFLIFKASSIGTGAAQAVASTAGAASGGMVGGC